MTKGERIRELRIEHKMTQEQLADMLNIKKQTVHKYEKNIITNIPSDKIEQMAKIFSVSPLFIMGYDDTLEPFDIPEMIPIPVLGCIHAGDPVTAQECVEDTPVYIPKDWTQSGQIYRGLRIKGNSMLPKIQDGDRVIFRVTPDCSSGDIVIARIDGDDATVKRFLKDSGIVTLQPLNSDYSPIIFTGDEAEPTLEILGVVVQLVRDI